MENNEQFYNNVREKLIKDKEKVKLSLLNMYKDDNEDMYMCIINNYNNEIYFEFNNYKTFKTKYEIEIYICNYGSTHFDGIEYNIYFCLTNKDDNSYNKFIDYIIERMKYIDKNYIELKLDDYIEIIELLNIEILDLKNNNKQLEKEKEELEEENEELEETLDDIRYKLRGNNW